MHKGNYNPKYVTRLDQIPQLDRETLESLGPVTEKFGFRANEYYLSLIDWNDPDDPIRRLVIPDVRELDTWGRLDASNEETYIRVPGLEHKYDSVALLLVNNVCGAFCRFCFRKRLFMEENVEVQRDVTAGIEYIRRHPEISDVLVTGGDPLLLSTRQLRDIVGALREIDHVDVIRIGSKLISFNPYRIINDPDLHAMFKEFSTPEQRIYVMCHFNHPREIAPPVVEALDILHRCGTIRVNQTPMIAGINDDPDVLAELFHKCTALGIPPYYVFQCRPTVGNKTFSVPLEKAFKIFETAKMKGSGLTKRARFCMSHSTGKIEVMGLTARHIIMKYHRSADPDMCGRVLIFERDPSARWFDDYTVLVDEYQLENPYASEIFVPEFDEKFLDKLG
jgi:KamA family protein